MSPRAAASSQGDLFAGGKGGESRLDKEFKGFHAANPHVYLSLVRMARTWKERGFPKVGIGMLWEVLRYHEGLRTKGDPNFKLNNNHRSRFARLIMERESDLKDFFETRTLTS